jgi:phosphoribosyl 1,2-cyclic phosphate phosphodiesterase
MQLRVLGCGSSGGVPNITGNWGNCNANDPRNHRTRQSLSIHLDNGEIWLIDAGPDVRAQLLREKIERIDGLFLTHAHFDHIMGLDEIRIFAYKQKKCIPFYTDAITLSLIRKTFPYLIGDLDAPTILPKKHKRVLNPILLQETFLWHGHMINTFVQPHGNVNSIGYHFGTWAYSTDVRHLDKDQLQALKGIKIWFVECLSYHPPHPAHTHLDAVLQWIDVVKPERTILIHMGASLDYETLKKRLPPAIEPAYDGMVINL